VTSAVAGGCEPLGGFNGVGGPVPGGTNGWDGG
jgi:hypothetical protein